MREPVLISDLSLRDYVLGTRSLFRRYQDIFLAQNGREITGSVVELGGEKKYDHGRFFPSACSFVCTNIAGDYDERVDLLDMPFANDSQDCFVCISVLEHVYPIQTALAEIHRTLKVGGKLLLAVPFAYPFHDEADYWRLGQSFYQERFQGYDVPVFTHLGGMFSTIVDVLQKPKRKLTKRYVAYKAIGFALTALGRPLERLDGFPLGYGIVAVKK